MDIIKIVIYLKDIMKPLVLTCDEEESKNKDLIVKKIKEMYQSSNTITKIDVASGDIIIVRPEDIKGVLITKSRETIVPEEKND